jgi:hypothetical protein
MEDSYMVKGQLNRQEMVLSRRKMIEGWKIQAANVFPWNEKNEGTPENLMYALIGTSLTGCATHVNKRDFPNISYPEDRLSALKSSVKCLRLIARRHFKNTPQGEVAKRITSQAAALLKERQARLDML